MLCPVCFENYFQFRQKTCCLISEVLIHLETWYIIKRIHLHYNHRSIMFCRIRVRGSLLKYHRYDFLHYTGTAYSIFINNKAKILVKGNPNGKETRESLLCGRWQQATTTGVQRHRAGGFWMASKSWHRTKCCGVSEEASVKGSGSQFLGVVVLWTQWQLGASALDRGLMPSIKWLAVSLSLQQPIVPAELIPACTPSNLRNKSTIWHATLKR